jgi:hypothetical protein
MQCDAMPMVVGNRLGKRSWCRDLREATMQWFGLGYVDRMCM